MESINRKGVLYIVSTPIGNLGDITLRAIETLREVDWIAAEDTRHSAKLLDHFSIKTPVFSLHEHNESARLNHIKKLLDDGKNIALISDAGTPLISDPGYLLVSVLREQEYEISSVPGPSAVISALSVSGLPSRHFYFEGFLSAKAKQRQERLMQLQNLDATVICYESPHRIMDMLEDISTVMGVSRRVCVARELTKRFETVSLGEIDSIITLLKENSQQQKGEFVVMIEGLEHEQIKKSVIDKKTLMILEELSSVLPTKKVAQIVSDYSGIPKKPLYEQLLSLKKQ